MRLNMRIVSKLGLLLAIIGFFMPVACDKNAFQLIEYADKTSGAFIVILFILAFIGLIIGLFLLMKNNVPIGIDWIIILACVCIGIGLLIKYNLEFQYGAYVIITGFCISFVFLLIASFISDSDYVYNNSESYSSSDSSLEKNEIKKCPFCAEEIKKEAIVCRYCGKDLPNEEVKEINLNIQLENNSNIKNIAEDEKNMEIERLEKLFDSSTDETEKGIIAKKLYDLGKMYYWRFIPREKK